MSNTKNLGQVAGLFIGLSAPENTALIWYDSTPNQQCHKVYDTAKKAWVVLNPQIVAQTTYSELVNNAKNNGLSIGKFYQITDKTDAFAIAIALTKVQYVDNAGNILIDDLGANIQYCVSSNNLLFDGLSGVWDETSGKLLFTFSEKDLTETDYLLGKARNGNKWELAKYVISKIVSAVSGNSLSWNKGVFFSFKSAITNILNKDGGVVGYTLYKEETANLQTSLDKVAEQNSQIIENANKAIKESTADDAIFDKKNTRDIDTTIAPGDIIKGDTLFGIISKVQRWINSFKYATGVRISRLFSDAESKQYINNNDTVESALGKVQYLLKNPTEVYQLPETWTDEPSEWNSGDAPKAGDSFGTVFAKISNFCKNAFNTVRLSSIFKILERSSDIELPKAGESFEEVTAKLAGKLEQIGDITDGKVSSKTKAGDNPCSELDLGGGSITFRSKVSTVPEVIGEGVLNSEGLSFSENADALEQRKYFTLSSDILRYENNGMGVFYNQIRSSALILNTSGVSAYNCAFQAYNLSQHRNSFDAYFQKLRLGGLSLSAYLMTSASYSVSTSSFVNFNASVSGDIYLPSNPADGTIIYIAKSSAQTLNIHSQGEDEIDTVNESNNVVTIKNNRGALFILIYIEGVTYSPKNTAGLWYCGKVNSQFS